MILSERLKTVIELAGKGNIVADIGCDHAFVSISLVANNCYKRAIAMDINDGPLIKANEHILENHLKGKIETRKSNGLNKLTEDNVDTVIITGMGGPLIENIIKNDIDKACKVKKLILGPQSDLAHFRRFLYDNKFEIINEKYLFEDGKYYTLIVAGYNTNLKEYKDDDKDIIFEFGQFVAYNEDNVFTSYIDNQYKQYSQIKKNLSERLAFYETELNNMVPSSYFDNKNQNDSNQAINNNGVNADNIIDIVNFDDDHLIDDNEDETAINLEAQSFRKLLTKKKSLNKRLDDISRYLELLEKVRKGGKS